jgi:ATP-binding cassette, subfamily B, multidrug efflux pump
MKLKEILKTLAGSIREYKKDSILAPTFIMGEVILECILPYVMSFLINSIYAKDLKQVIIYGICLVLVAICSFIAGVGSGVFGARGSAGFAKNLRYDVFTKVQTFSFANIDKFSTSSLVTRLTTDITNIQMAYMMIIRVAIRAPFMLIFSFVMAAIMNIKLALIFVVLMPILGTLLALGVLKTHPIFEKVFKKYDALNESVEENIKAARVVKAYVKEDYEKEKFHKVSEDVRRDFTKAERIVAISSPAMQFCIYIAIILISLFASIIVVKTGSTETTIVDGVPVVSFVAGEFSVGQLQSFIAYGFQMLMSMMMLAMILVMIVMAQASSKRVAEVLVETPTIQNPENPVYDVKDGSVEFKNVSFKYNEKAEKNALNNINLSIKSGETVGIIGGTGSSKSSLIQLISRLYDATEGEVYVGGVNVKNYDLVTLRDQVSVVLQKNVLFSGTIAENLRWGDKNASDEEVIKAAKLAQADDFIMSFPEGYNHYIEQGGSNVSGGQKQRLCIARAILKKPKIIILDDSTSAVDTKTDALIRKAFKEELPNTTKIVIAQRIASVQDADKIIVMDNGEINAIGNHEELLKSNEIYQEVYYSQNKIDDKKVEGGAQ